MCVLCTMPPNGQVCVPRSCPRPAIVHSLLGVSFSFHLKSKICPGDYVLYKERGSARCLSVCYCSTRRTRGGGAGSPQVPQKRASSRLRCPQGQVRHWGADLVRARIVESEADGPG